MKHMKNINQQLQAYKKELQKGDIQIAYGTLVKYVANLSTIFSKKMSLKYAFGGVFQGYMDYTYFYFTNDFLKKNKLKFGLVLNHFEMRFELWLLGATKPVQKKYWEALKTSKWNDRKEMPQYAILEVILVDNPDFSNLEMLTKNIESNLIQISGEIMDECKNII